MDADCIALDNPDAALSLEEHGREEGPGAQVFPGLTPPGRAPTLRPN